MTGNFLRSTVFNLLFYVLTGLACLVCLPTLILPRRYFMGVVYGFVRSVYFLERFVLGLEMEIRGIEHVPADGAYIVAAKHQSAYETFKLHLLFKDPAVILKRELLGIPLWGLYLKKSDPIAIDRSNPEGAIASIQEGAQRVAAQGRPIVIFPQGTRVSPDQTPADKPYKIGVIRVQEATNLPIIPVALNAGVFWPKHKWVKRRGRVAISFLPPLLPYDAKDRGEALKKLETAIEAESLSLCNEARERMGERHGGFRGASLVFALSILLLFGIYSIAWFQIAARSKLEYTALMADFGAADIPHETPQITGYPGKMRFYVPQETLEDARGRLTVQDLRIEGWPLPYTPIAFQTGPVALRSFLWDGNLAFDSLAGRIRLEGTQVNILEGFLVQGDFKAGLSGLVDMKAKPEPLIDLEVSAEKPISFLQTLAGLKIIEPRMALFIGAGLTSFQDKDGIVRVPLYRKDFRLFVGPLPVMQFDPPYEYDPDLGARLVPVP